MLNGYIFRKILHEMKILHQVLFASRITNQRSNYVTHHPETGALHINAFTIPWDNFYAFFHF